jgi:hypothetical protein
MRNERILAIEYCISDIEKTYWMLNNIQKKDFYWIKILSTDLKNVLQEYCKKYDIIYCWDSYWYNWESNLIFEI